MFIFLHWEGTNFFFLLCISNIVETSAELRQKFPPPNERLYFLIIKQSRKKSIQSRKNPISHLNGINDL